MARIRTIKPDFFKDEDLAEHNPLTRILFTGLWTLSDRDGRQEDRPKFIKAEILPYDNCDVNEMLQALHDTGFITRYKVEDRAYIHVHGFKKHQRITGKEAETPSLFPPPPNEKQLGNIGDIPNVQEGKGKEGNEEGKGNEKYFCSDGYKPSEPSPMSDEMERILPTLKRVKLENPAMLFEVWKAAFPDVGIEKCILACDAWAVSKNVTRTPKGWSRTLNTWLGKEQDRAIPKGGSNGNSRITGEAGYTPGKYAHLS